MVARAHRVSQISSVGKFNINDIRPEILEILFDHNGTYQNKDDKLGLIAVRDPAAQILKEQFPEDPVVQAILDDIANDEHKSGEVYYLIW